MDKLALNSYAKLNLYLEVLKKRKDNYHNLKTVFERIDLSDRIILKSRPDKKITITCNHRGVPLKNSNLCYQSAKLLQDSLKIDKGVDIKITKCIPVGAGLGGGSSNAAAVLSGLNKIWGLRLSQKELVYYAKKIGADVPFFLYNYPFAKASARGDRIEQLRALNKVRLWHILVVPGIKVSTPLIYRKWDVLQGKKVELTRPKYDVKILTSAIRKKDLTLMGEVSFNSLERASTRLNPAITRVKERLKEMTVKTILMSGSGPAVFGIVSSRKEAVSLCKQLKKESGFGQVFVTRTI